MYYSRTSFHRASIGPLLLPGPTRTYHFPQFAILSSPRDTINKGSTVYLNLDLSLSFSV